MSTRRRRSPHGLGARYGRTVRKRLAEVEADLRKRHYCQNCGAKAVKRLSVGVWQCSKCGLTFSGGAYSPSSEVGEAAKRSVESAPTE
jgi:large subunit ribosomal protein L37Ae